MLFFHMLKRCTKCGIIKAIIEFTKRETAKQLHRSRCKACSKIDSRNWRERNPAKVAASASRRRRNPARKRRHEFTIRRWHIRKKYNLTAREFLVLKKLQKNLCPICAKRLPAGLKAAIDHCHLSGRIRGLLHIQCNTALGMLKDNYQSALRAAKYIEKYAS